MRALLFVLVWLLTLPALADSPGQVNHYDAYMPKVFSGPEGDLRYRLMLPENFDPSRQYPFVLFLHGAGERGNDNRAQLTHGAQVFLQQRQAFPAIVVFPQAPEDDYWAQVKADRSSLPFHFSYLWDGQNQVPATHALSNVMALTEQIISKSFVDKKRVYVAGLSMGGMGTLELLARKPEWFAAAIAICPGANPAITAQFNSDLKLRIYHGADDQIVVPALSAAVAASAKPHIRYLQRKVYPQTNHNSWDAAFAEPDFLSWLMQQRKP